MEQREINFEVKDYTFKEDYAKDNFPVVYYEFNKHEYYGLIAIKNSSEDLSNKRFPLWKQAVQTYFETVGGESMDEIITEGYPKKISKSEALLKFLLAPDMRNETVADLVTQFEKIENGLILIDSNLI